MSSHCYKPILTSFIVYYSENPNNLGKSFSPELNKLLRWMVRKSANDRPSMERILYEPPLNSVRKIDPLTPTIKPGRQFPIKEREKRPESDISIPTEDGGISLGGSAFGFTRHPSMRDEVPVEVVEKTPPPPRVDSDEEEREEKKKKKKKKKKKHEKDEDEEEEKVKTPQKPKESPKPIIEEKKEESVAEEEEEEESTTVDEEETEESDEDEEESDDEETEEESTEGESVEMGGIWEWVKTGNMSKVSLFFDNNSGNQNQFLNKGHDEFTENGFSLLHFACECGHVDIVKHLLAINADCNERTKNKDAKTPLHICATANRVECGLLLLNEGAKVEKRTKKSQRTALHLAAIKGNLDFVKMLLENDFVSLLLKRKSSLIFSIFFFLIQQKADVFARASEDDELFMAIHFAAEKGHTKVCKYLANYDKRLLNAPDIDGDLPINVAAKNDMNETALALVKIDKKQLKALGYGGQTALHSAADSGNCDLVRDLIKQGANVHCKANGYNGYTPLLLAISSGKVKVVKQLLTENGASWQEKDGEGDNALHVAVKKGKSNVLQLLVGELRKIKSIDIESKGFNGRTALHTAAVHGKKDCALVLMKQGCDVNAKSGKGDHNGNALHLSCFYGCSEIVDDLLDFKIDTNQRDDFDNLPIHVACIGGHLKCLEIILSKQPDALEQRGFHRRTPLHQCCWKNQSECAEYLLDHGANVEVKSGPNDDEMTPLEMAVYYESLETVEVLLRKGASKMPKVGVDGGLHIAAKMGNCEMAEMLIENGFNLESKGFMDRTPMLTSCTYGKSQILGFFLDNGANLYATSGKKDSSRHAIHLASCSGNSEVVQVLFNNSSDIDPDVKDDNGDSALHLAASKGDPDCCRVLLENGASADLKGYADKTPLHQCVSFCDNTTKAIETLQVLLAKGADINSKAGDDDLNITPLGTAALLGNGDIANFLIANGANIEQTDAVSLFFFNMVPLWYLLIYSHNLNPNLEWRFPVPHCL